jgi:hypothetical protein
VSDSKATGKANERLVGGGRFRDAEVATPIKLGVFPEGIGEANVELSLPREARRVAGDGDELDVATDLFRKTPAKGDGVDELGVVPAAAVADKFF